MKFNKIKLRIIISIQAIFFASIIFGQSETAPEMIKWEKFGNEQNWDSAIFYAKVLEQGTKRDYGDTSIAHAIMLCHYLGYTYAIVGDYTKAYQVLKKGIIIFKTLQQTKNSRYIEAVFYLGIVSVSIGANSEAEAFLEEFIKISKGNWRIGDYIQSNINLAGIYSAKGEFAKAEFLNFSMKKIVDTMAPSYFTHYMQASIYNNLASISSQTGDVQKTLINLTKACELQRIAIAEGANRDEYLKILLNLAEAFAINNKIDSALKKCQQVEDSLSKKNNNLIFSDMLAEKALIYQQKHQYEKAVRTYKSYIEVVDSLTIKPDSYFLNLINLGLVYINTNHFETADSLFRKLSKTIQDSGLHYSYAMLHALNGLCKSLMHLKKYGEATDSILALIKLSFKAMDNNFAGMSEEEQLKYRTDLDNVFDLLYTCIYNTKNTKPEVLVEVFKLEMQRKNIVLDIEKENLKRMRLAGDSTSILIYKTWLTNKQILAKQYSLPYKQRFLNVDSVEEAINLLEKTLNVSGFTPFSNSANLPLTKGSIKTVLIQFVRFNSNINENLKKDEVYAAFILKSQDIIPKFIYLFKEKSLLDLMKNATGKQIDETQLVQKFYASNQQKNELYDYVWKPLQPYIKNAMNINYATEGLLNNISFNAMHDNNGFLMNRYNFRRFSSLANAEMENDLKKISQSISIWGNINYGKGEYVNDSTDTEYKMDNSNIQFSNLSSIKITVPAQKKYISKNPLFPFDTTEVASIKTIFDSCKINCVSYENQVATEEEFKKQAKSFKGILHISTHGFYTPKDIKMEKELLPGDYIASTPNPLFRCGLAFSGVNYYWMKGTPKNNHDDGILTGYEITQLNLENVSLVSLSACETALGDVVENEGNIGLQRAFKIAGVQNIIVSLWEVPIKQTSELFVLFYKNLVSGTALSDALQNAQKTMQKREYPPYYWAGFILIE